MEQSRNNGPLYKRAKTSITTSSTIHNVVKRFWQSGEIWVSEERRTKKKNQYLMAMTFSLSGCGALKNTFNSGHRCKGSGRLQNELKPTVKSEKSKLQVLFWKPQNQNKEAGNQRSLQKAWWYGGALVPWAACRFGESPLTVKSTRRFYSNAEAVSTAGLHEGRIWRLKWPNLQTRPPHQIKTDEPITEEGETPATGLPQRPDSSRL